MIGLLVFFCLYSAKNGGSALMETVDSIQPGWERDKLLLSTVSSVIILKISVLLKDRLH